MDDKKKQLEYELADIITEKPHEFTIGRKHYRLYPVTLAKLFLLRRYIDDLSIDQNILKVNPNLEAIRLVEKHKETCCGILAIHTAPNTYKDIHNRQNLAERRNAFAKVCNEDLATMMIVVLTSDKTEQVVILSGIEKERERLKAAMEAKKDGQKGSLHFGGITIFGSFIAPLLEMGLSINEILYERSYSFLRLILADKMAQVFLSEEELQNLAASAGGTMIDGNDPESFDKLKGSLKGIKFND